MLHRRSSGVSVIGKGKGDNRCSSADGETVEVKVHNEGDGSGNLDCNHVITSCLQEIRGIHLLRRSSSAGVSRMLWASLIAGTWRLDVGMGENGSSYVWD